MEMVQVHLFPKTSCSFWVPFQTLSTNFDNSFILQFLFLGVLYSLFMSPLTLFRSLSIPSFLALFWSLLFFWSVNIGLIEMMTLGVQRDDSVVKSPFCSHRGPKLISLHLCSTAHNHPQLQIWRICLLWPVWSWYSQTHTCTIPTIKNSKY